MDKRTHQLTEKERYFQELHEIVHGNEEIINAIMDENLRTLISWEDLFNDKD